MSTKKFTGTMIVEFEFDAEIPDNATYQEASELAENFEFKLAFDSRIYCTNSRLVSGLEIITSYVDDIGAEEDEFKKPDKTYYTELNQIMEETSKSNKDLLDRLEVLETQSINNQSRIRYIAQAIDNIADILDENNIATPWEVNKRPSDDHK